MDAHKVDYLHTTDAVSLGGDFAKVGWDETASDALIEDCVNVIEQHIGSPQKLGLFVATLTIPLSDYLKAKKEVPALPNSAAEICATESLSFCLKWGKAIGAKYYHLYYDQGEPFYGHIDTRIRNGKARRSIPLLDKVVDYGQVNMRYVPAVQMADLFAWCISHNDHVVKSWHKRLHGFYWFSLFLDYPLLLNPQKSALNAIASWNLPKRALMR